MFLHWKPKKSQPSGFTFGDVLMAFMVFTIVIAGLIYGYVQVNRMAIFSSMSLAAQSFASQGLEEAKSVQWNYVRGSTNEDATDPFWTPPSVGTTNLPPQVDTLDIPTVGTPFYVTNYVTITSVFTNLNPNNPPVRQIQCRCVWALPATMGSGNGTTPCYTNYAVTLRAPDE
jgi:Tfp pilus assembly protein PilV